MDKMNIILNTAAEIFEVDIKKLSINTSRDELEQWDSLNHLRLISEIEENLSINIPFEKVVKIKTLKDFEMFLNSREGS